jgi:NADH-quinone oxidoreductase subunit F
MSKDIIRQNQIPGIKTYEVYRQNGGYASVEKAMKAMTLTKLLNK